MEDYWKEWEDSMGGDENYFSIKEGDNKFILLSYITPLAQVYDPTTNRYRIATAEDENVSIKGICHILQSSEDDSKKYIIKEASLPLSVTKSIRAISENPDWDFKFPFPNWLTLTAIGAKTKEVKYNLVPSPTKFEIPDYIIKELATKPTSKEIVEQKMAKSETSDSPKSDSPKIEPVKYPESDIKSEDIPF